MKINGFRFLVVLIVYLISSTMLQAEHQLEKVTLQLNWKYQFAYAGYIAAKEKGFYKDEGLDVEIIEYQPGDDTVNAVLEQHVSYGVHSSSIIAKDKKIVPTVLMATYFQRPPLVLVASKDIKHPADLLGKKIMGTKDQQQYGPLALLLGHFNISEDNSTFVEHTFSIEKFVQHEVDAMSAFRSNELFDLDQRGIEYNIIDPADYGFVMSAGNLFTSRAEASSYPERTQRFIKASNRGWAYALEHPEELVTIIYEQYSKQKSVEALRYEADITKQIMLTDFYEIGATNRDLAERTLIQLIRDGSVDKREALGKFIFKDVSANHGTKISFSKEEKNYLDKKGEIRMCVDPNWMPFESIKNGKYIGIAAEIIGLLKAHISIPVTVVLTETWEESVEKAKARECDIYSLAASTPKRIKYMDFTQSYLDLPIVMATDMRSAFISDIVQVKDHKIGIVKGYAIAEFLRNNIEGINIVDVESIQDGLRKVERGELYGYVDNLMTIASSIQKDFTGVLKISARLDEKVELAVGTRNDEPLLQSIFEKLLSTVDDEQKQEIYNKWVTVTHEVGTDYSLVWKFMAAILLIAIALLYHYFKLRVYKEHLEELVEEKTIDLQRSTEVAETANQAKTLFLANISHELRTPMHAILSFVRICQKKVGTAPKEQMEGYLSNIEISGKRLLVLLNDLLDLSKLEASESKFNSQGHDLALAVSAIVTELELLAQEKNIHLFVEHPMVGTVIHFDFHKILQVIRNLLSNAIKFSHDGGRVTISINGAELFDKKNPGKLIPAIALTVTDEGIGIPDDELKIIFNQFVQSSKTDTGSGGTGLGLAICKEIVEGHGGTISAENNHKGGSQFIFILPR